MTIEQLKERLTKQKDLLKMLNEAGASVSEEDKKEIKDNIVKIEDEIAKLEDEAKPKAKGKKEKKTKVVKTKKEKTPIEKTPAREVQKAIEIAHPHHQKFKIDETAKEQQLGHLTLIKKNDNCFVLYLKKEGMEITFLKTSTADGMKWVTTYYKDKETTHNTLQDAVNAAVNRVFTDEIQEIFEQQKARAKNTKKWKEKREKAGKPAELTIVEDAEKATDKIEEKVEATVKENKVVSMPQANAIIRNYVESGKVVFEGTNLPAIAQKQIDTLLNHVLKQIEAIIKHYSK